ncbi:hypothetical protein GF386_05920 [Candidatus Pacearchaeota archaeon]|nr:hypothetical protein [Candidatus Pacearchaeota archaeon]MBD3283630.1 hypothetical protein [Candidatus Pacearchaeota archaeon]
MLERRVVVTGLGVECPLAGNLSDYEQRLNNGDSSIIELRGEYRWLDNYPIHVGSLMPLDYQIPDNVLSGIDKKEARRIRKMPLGVRMGLSAADQAVRDSGFLDLPNINERTGVSMGVGFGNAGIMESQSKAVVRHGMGAGDRFFMLKVIPNAAPGVIAGFYGFHSTDASSIASACSSGSSAIKYGFEQIQLGNADIMVCGGVMESSTPVIFSGFNGVTALSLNEDPETASRPFDRDRDGFVLGEGSGVIILEELEHAKKRGVRIYAHLLGCYANNNANHSTQPDLKYQTLAIKRALSNAGVDPEDIDYINCHGTSTRLNDPFETQSIKDALGEHAREVLLNSTKSLIGHTISGAGSLETIATILTLNNGVVHPTRGLFNRDVDYVFENGNTEIPMPCDLQYCNEAIKGQIEVALKNSFGFYGSNVVLVLGKP